METEYTKEFDENDALKFIRNYIPQPIKNKYSDDDLVLLMDTIYDYYEEEDDIDLWDEDTTHEEQEAEVNRIVNYVKKNLRKDSDNQIEMDDVKSLVLGELEYEKTLEED